jgi:branched-chain amino acid aminotransferase
MTIISVQGQTNTARARSALSGPLGFGKVFADLMVRAHHSEERGWYDVAVVPFAPLSLSPAAKALHYGLEIFEGHKAYNYMGGDVALFRPELNAHRLNSSAKRLRMPEIELELQLRATEMLVDCLRAWVPEEPDAALYLRPMMLGTESAIGVSPANEHLYLVIASPVGSYFEGGFEAISVKLEERHVRAALGGIGAIKAGGNYAAGMDAQARARSEGFDQVLWLDAREHRYLEELGAMNIFVVRKGVLTTPALTDTILPGITRQSLLELASKLGIQVAEKPIAIDQLVDDIESHFVEEIFCAGTAAVITPVGHLGYLGRRIPIADAKPGPVTRTLYEQLSAIQYGRAPDLLRWMRVVPHSDFAHGRSCAGI